MFTNINVTKATRFYSTHSTNQTNEKKYFFILAKYCSRDTMPGGEGGLITIFPAGINSMSVYLQCPVNTIASNNVTRLIFQCSKGIWEVVPDCVHYVRNDGNCPAGYRAVIRYGVSERVCGMCFVTTV